MNLDEIKKEVANLHNYSEDLIFQYRDTIKYLSNIYDILNRYNSPLAYEVNRLIDKYYDMIKTIQNNYAQCLDNISKYVHDTNDNFYILSNNIAKATNNFNSLVNDIKA